MACNPHLKAVKEYFTHILHTLLIPLASILKYSLNIHNILIYIALNLIIKV